MPENFEPPAAAFGGDWSGQLVATAIHTGHDLRDEIRDAMRLDEQTRLREEDPFTDAIGSQCPARLVVHRSRFEVDLNRDREGCVYRRPEDAWDLEVWRENPLPADLSERSAQIHDAFYADLGARLDEVAARGPFVIYDVLAHDVVDDESDLHAAPSMSCATSSAWSAAASSRSVALGSSR